MEIKYFKSKSIMKSKMFFMIVTALSVLVGCQSNEVFLKEDLYGKLAPESMPNNKTELVMLINATGLPALHMCYDDLQIKWSAADDALGYDAAEYLSMENFGAINSDQQIDIRHGWERCYGSINTNNNVINNYEKVTDMSEADLNLLRPLLISNVHIVIFIW
jgi:hypothetical protein